MVISYSCDEEYADNEVYIILVMTIKYVDQVR
jgi:hypothetical protein